MNHMRKNTVILQLKYVAELNLAENKMIVMVAIQNYDLQNQNEC